MSDQARSIDELPLAAYSTGMVEDEPARGRDAATADPAAADTPMNASPATEPLAAPPPGPPSGVVVTVVPAGSARTPKTAASTPPRRPTLAFPTDLRATLREPRTLAAGAVVLGVLILAVTLGGGLGSGAPVPSATASPAPTLVAQPAGAATLTLSGGLTGTYSLAGSTGLGRPADNRLASTWTDVDGNTLALTGKASSGTRPTAPDFVLTWSVTVDGKPVTFTSNRGECVLGMAVKPRTVSGSITCTNLASDDGKLVVGIAGNYRT